MEKWQEQVEAILKEKYQGDEGMLKAANRRKRFPLGMPDNSLPRYST